MWRVKPRQEAAGRTVRFVAFCLLACCGGDAAPEQAWDWRDGADAAIDAWRDRYTYPQQCAQARESLEVLVAPELDVCTPEQVYGTVAGCYSAAQHTVLILERLSDHQKTDVMAHEQLHVLLTCDGGDPDAGHLAPGIWMCAGAQSCGNPDLASLEADALARVFAE